MLTKEEIRRIRAEAEKATGGPWRKGSWSSILGCPVMAQPDKKKNQFNICSAHRGEMDGSFIASSRTNVPALCNTALEALERVEELKRLCLERKVKINKLTEAIERVIRFFRADKDKLPFAIEYAEERVNDVLNPKKEGK